jgi:hypothetical protein
MGTVASAWRFSYVESVSGRIVTQADSGINRRSYRKNNKRKRIRGLAEMVECLLSKHKALGSKGKK